LPTAGIGKDLDHGKLYLTVSTAGLKTLADVRKVVIGSGAAGAAHVGDVADVVDGAAPLWTRAVADGNPAVLFQVYEQPGGNVVQIARRRARPAGRDAQAVSARRRPD